jgi:hypothetical protein
MRSPRTEFEEYRASAAEIARDWLQSKRAKSSQCKRIVARSSEPHHRERRQNARERGKTEDESKQDHLLKDSLDGMKTAVNFYLSQIKKDEFLRRASI